MKLLLLLGLILTQSVFALPYVCESTELDNGKAVLRLKVNDKVPKYMGGETWNLYLVGATPSEGFRQIVYGSGSADQKGITMTFVKDSFVLGSVLAYPHGDGLFYGEASLSGIAKNKSLSVVCRDEAKP
jgi:hypothetical protein